MHAHTQARLRTHTYAHFKKITRMHTARRCRWTCSVYLLRVDASQICTQPHARSQYAHAGRRGRHTRCEYALYRYARIQTSTYAFSRTLPPKHHTPTRMHTACKCGRRAWNISCKYTLHGDTLITACITQDTRTTAQTYNSTVIHLNIVKLRRQGANISSLVGCICVGIFNENRTITLLYSCAALT